MSAAESSFWDGAFSRAESALIALPLTDYFAREVINDDQSALFLAGEYLESAGLDFGSDIVRDGLHHAFQYDGMSATDGGTPRLFREFDINIQTKTGRGFTHIGFDVVGALRETHKNAVVWQFRGYKEFDDADNRKGFNTGLIYRHGIMHGLAGVNSFFDYETYQKEAFWRYSIGGEFRTAMFGVYGNYYGVLTDDRVLNATERLYSSDGYDLEMHVHTPKIPEVSGVLGYYSWEGKYGNDDEDGALLGVRFTPMQWPVMLELDYRSGEGESFGGNLELLFEFGKSGVATSSHVRENGAFHIRDHFFATAEREYTQRIALGTVSAPVETSNNQPGDESGDGSGETPGDGSGGTPGDGSGGTPGALNDNIHQLDDLFGMANVRGVEVAMQGGVSVVLTTDVIVEVANEQSGAAVRGHRGGGSPVLRLRGVYRGADTNGLLVTLPWQFPPAAAYTVNTQAQSSVEVSWNDGRARQAVIYGDSEAMIDRSMMNLVDGRASVSAGNGFVFTGPGGVRVSLSGNSDIAMNGRNIEVSGRFMMNIGDRTYSSTRSGAELSLSFNAEGVITSSEVNSAVNLETVANPLSFIAPHNVTNSRLTAFQFEGATGLGTAASPLVLPFLTEYAGVFYGRFVFDDGSNLKLGTGRGELDFPGIPGSTFGVVPLGNERINGHLVYHLSLKDFPSYGRHQVTVIGTVDNRPMATVTVHVEVPFPLSFVPPHAETDSRIAPHNIKGSSGLGTAASPLRLPFLTDYGGIFFGRIVFDGGGSDIKAGTRRGNLDFPGLTDSPFGIGPFGNEEIDGNRIFNIVLKSLPAGGRHRLTLIGTVDNQPLVTMIVHIEVAGGLSFIPPSAITDSRLVPLHTKGTRGLGTANSPLILPFSRDYEAGFLGRIDFDGAGSDIKLGIRSNELDIAGTQDSAFGFGTFANQRIDGHRIFNLIAKNRPAYGSHQVTVIGTANNNPVTTITVHIEVPFPLSFIPPNAETDSRVVPHSIEGSSGLGTAASPLVLPFLTSYGGIFLGRFEFDGRGSDIKLGFDRGKLHLSNEGDTAFGAGRFGNEEKDGHLIYVMWMNRLPEYGSHQLTVIGSVNNQRLVTMTLHIEVPHPLSFVPPHAVRDSRLTPNQLKGTSGLGTAESPLILPFFTDYRNMFVGRLAFDAGSSDLKLGTGSGNFNIPDRVGPFGVTPLEVEKIDGHVIHQIGLKRLPAGGRHQVTVIGSFDGNPLVTITVHIEVASGLTFIPPFFERNSDIIAASFTGFSDGTGTANDPYSLPPLARTETSVLGRLDWDGGGLRIGGHEVVLGPGGGALDLVSDPSSPFVVIPRAGPKINGNTPFVLSIRRSPSNGNHQLRVVGSVSGNALVTMTLYIKIDPGLIRSSIEGSPSLFMAELGQELEFGQELELARQKRLSLPFLSSAFISGFSGYNLSFGESIPRFRCARDDIFCERRG